MIDIVQRVIESKARKIQMWPVKSNRASEMGHPCLRYLVYLRTRGEERPLHDIGLQFIFDEGNLHEAAVLRDLQNAGVQVVEQQRPFEWKKYNITGSIDAKIIDNGAVVPIEIKSFSDWNWKAINTAEDMFKSKAIYMQKYPAQLTLYLIMDEKEEGAFILKNKTNGMLKQIPMGLDFDYAESLVAKAERVNTHVQGETLPERIQYSDNICGTCSFAHICLPDVDRQAILIEDPELEHKLDRRWELKAAKDEFDDLDKEIRDALKEKAEAVIGSFAIKGKWVDKKEYTVQASRYWSMTIKKI